MHRSRSVRRFAVTTDGRNLWSRVPAGRCSLSWPIRTGLTGAMSEAMADCGISWNTHDPGVVLTHLGVAIADGADCLSDFEALRSSPVFGDVASVSTAWRAVKATTSLQLRRIRTAGASARERLAEALPDHHRRRRHPPQRPLRKAGGQCHLQAGASAFTPSDRGATPRASRSMRSFVPAGPAPTMPATTSSSSTGPSPCCRLSTSWVINRAITRHSWLTTSSYGPTRPAAATALSARRGEHRVLDRPSHRCQGERSLVVVPGRGLGECRRGGRRRR